MTNQEIFELFDRFERSSIRQMRIADGAFSMELSKDAGTVARAAAVQPGFPDEKESTAASSQHSKTIPAPLAGVFYAQSEPGAAPYVVVGSRVKAGETVCLMEAMKMISEIPAPCDCVITEILKENGALAAFDEPLFRYQPC